MFGSNRPLKPCRPGVRFKQALGAMSSSRGADGLGSMASRAVIERFLLLCSASHRLTTSNAKHFLSNAHASAGMTWEADLCCFSVVTGLWSHVVQALGSNRPLKPCHPRGGRCDGLGSMASRAVTERFLLLCSASHRFLSHPHASAGMTWEAGACCFSVVTGLWNRVIQALGSNRPLKPCHPSVRFKQAIEAMSSPRGVVRWHGIYGFKGRHKRGFCCFVPPPIDSSLTHIPLQK